LSVILVDLERVDDPVGVFKGSRVVCNEIAAAARLGFASTIIAPDFTSPRTAKGEIEDDVVILEAGSNVARAAEPLSCWLTPASWIRGASGDVSRDSAAGEVVDGNASIGPMSSIDTATSSIEAISISSFGSGLDSASSVGSLATSVDVAV